jgi:hypothetical protein
MDFDPYESHWREKVPSLTLVEMCWELRNLRGRLLMCGYQNDCGLEGPVFVRER